MKNRVKPFFAKRKPSFSAKSIRRTLRSLDAAEASLRRGEDEMARREQANERPVSLRAANRSARLMWKK